MTWKLFIDDERNLEDVTWAPFQIREKYRNEEWVICRNGQEFMREFLSRGMPSYISFDHDLGEDSGTGYDILKLLIDVDIETPNDAFRFPENFSFYVHSQNPIGKANIEGLLNSYLEHREW
jgi:hypothetical protein